MANLQQKKSGNVTWAQAFRDVGLRFFSSSKYVPTLAFILAIVIALRMPTSDMLAFAKTLIETGPQGERTLSGAAIAFAFLGWILAGFFLGGAIYTIRLIRRNDQAEITRITQERDSLQERLLQQPVQRSKLKDKNQ